MVLQDTDEPSLEEAKDRLIEELSSLCKLHKSHALDVVITQPWVKTQGIPTSRKNWCLRVKDHTQGRQGVHACRGRGAG